jgi:outer membrane protein assembly factor BamB
MMRLLLATALFYLSSQAQANLWPEFRGPFKNGHAPEAKVPLEWSERKNIEWRVEVEGKAWSSPVIIGDRIFITTAVEDGSDLSLRAQCHKLDDGSKIWTKEIFSREADHQHKKNSHASPTPLFEDGRLYCHFGHHGTAALDAASGEVLWKQESIKFKPVHGTGGSPALVGDKLIFSCDGAKDPVVVALNKNDGNITWETPRDVEVSRPFSFATPLKIEVAGRDQVVLPGSGAVISYNPEDGKEIWRFLYGEGYSVVPRPLYHDGKIYVCSGFNRAILYAVNVDAESRGDITESNLAWKVEKAIPKESSPIIVNDLLFVNDDKGILSCIDPVTGETHYSERLAPQGGYSSSPVYASDHLFFHNGEGITTVVKPDKRFDKVEENDIGEYGLSSFGVVSDGFIVRTEEALLRIK